MSGPVAVVLVALELTRLPPLGGPRPALWLAMRTGAGPSGALAGLGGRLYRVQPELVVALRPFGSVELYAGAGLAPVYLVRSGGRGAGPSVSSVLGVRLPLPGRWAIAFVARAEGVAGGGSAVSVDLQVTSGL